MKKITAIFFLFVYLLNATELGELFKIDTLVQHFYETNKTGKPVDFLSFLVMHYVTDDLNDKDNDRDKQLPFKSPETYFTNSTVLFTPFQPIQFIKTHAYCVKKPILYVTKDWLAVTDFKTHVWHPPKNL